MKKFGILTLSIVLATIVSACGNNGGNVEDGTSGDNPSGTNDDGIVEEENEMNVSDGDEDVTDEGADTEESWFEALSFDEYEVKADYDHGEYEADFENESGDLDAEIEDSRNGVDIEMEGEEALEELSGILPEMNIDENSSEDEVLAATINAFELDENYSDLEVKIEFLNGGETEADDEA